MSESSSETPAERREREAQEARERHEARVQRALHERIYLLGPVATPPSSGSASFLVSGQSGKVYTATLPILPSRSTATCNCIDHRVRKTVCKHLLFLSLRVFKLPRAALTAPAIPSAAAERMSSSDAALAAAGAHAAPPLLRSAFADVAAGSLPQPARKPVPARHPAPDDECPICYENLLPEPLAYCVFGCGRPVHAECFERYERATQEDAKCVLCRVPWRVEDGGRPLGRGGVRVGRRIVDLSEEVPHMFEGPMTRVAPAPRKRPAKRSRADAASSSDAAASRRRPARRKTGDGESSSADAVPKLAAGVVKRRSGRATAEARAAAVRAREGKGGRVTRAAARRASEGS